MTVELRRTAIKDLFELVSEPFVDTRGAFLNAFRSQEKAFISSWGDRGIAQVNLSRSECVGTIRGLHYQARPYSEAKLIRCLKGRVWDVVADLREDSVTYGQWYAIELTPELGNAILVPEGCAHGFQVLESSSELLYIHSGSWIPEAESGVIWNDPELAISWPLPPTELSDRDRSLPLLSEITFNLDSSCL